MALLMLAYTSFDTDEVFLTVCQSLYHVRPTIFINLISYSITTVW